jgi:N-6 DNA Methylase/TaqI-like C-terminal specificity domain
LQLSLFGQRPLFDDDTLSRRRSEWEEEPLAAFEQRARSMQNFSFALPATAGKETSLEQEFNRAFFVNLLGYQLYPGVEGSWTAWPKPPTAITGLDGEPDVILGHFGNDRPAESLVVVELKRPGTGYDSPQPSYRNRTPVEQAFDYAIGLPTCRWVFVSDMRSARLYSVDSREEYHELDLQAPSLAAAKPAFLREAYRLLAYDNFIFTGADSPTARLLVAARSQRAYLRDGFYGVYADIRATLLDAIESAVGDRFDRVQQVLGLQRLLDRLLFIFFCEDHPDRLLPKNLLRDLTDGAIKTPGSSRTKVYDQVKMLFRDLDTGADAGVDWKIPRYNGELFKKHEIIDEIRLPDQLYYKNFAWQGAGAAQLTVRGVYGLHIFDFWRALDRDLLGNLFERSIGDLEALAHGGRADARHAFGIFYTQTRLARFVASSAVSAMLEDDADLEALMSRVAQNGGTDHDIDEIVSLLARRKIADLTCGSGVFLTAALDALLTPYRKIVESLTAGGLVRELLSIRQSEILKACIFGVDLLPHAVELAKLALWLTAARRNEPSADLASNLFVADSLDPETISRLLANSGGGLDLILGNPPWGGEYNRVASRKILKELDVPLPEPMDSWEIFLALAVARLKPGGRFALLVPDTLFSADKKLTRDWLLSRVSLEKVYAFGPDWFSSNVRMGTVIIQGVAKRPDELHRIGTMVLAGRNRMDAQSGRRPLSQLEVALRQTIPQKVCQDEEEKHISVLSSEWDWMLFRRIESGSMPVHSISDRARGDEISADGILWRCGNCMAYNVPGEKAKGGGYRDKICRNCGSTLTAKNLNMEALVSDTSHGPYNVPYIDGKGLTSRYSNPLRRFLRTDLMPLYPPLKRKELFRGPKILIRQAGVGVVATIVDDDSRCPQSVYIYRVKEEARAQGYSNEFVLSCLVSRTMNFIIMKRFGEIDPARAFAKLTHVRIETLPLPTLLTGEDRSIAAEAARLVREMLSDRRLGGSTDHRIELLVRRLWGITPDEGRYINGFFSSLPDGQAVRDLFPDGAPIVVAAPSKNGEAERSAS